MANNQNRFNRIMNLKNVLIYFAIFVLISAAALFIIYEFFAEGTNLQQIFDFPLEILVSLIVLLFFYFLFDGLRLFAVLKTLEADISFFEIYKLVFINLFISNITPLASGGGVAQVYFLQNKGVPLGKSSAATLIRTLLATTMLFIGAPLVLLTNENMMALVPGNSVVYYFGAFLGLYLLFFYILIFKSRFLKKTIYRILYSLKSKKILSRSRYKKVLKYLFDNLELFTQDLIFFIYGRKIYVFLSFIFTVIFLVSEFSFSYLLLNGMGYDASFGYVITLQIVVVFLMYFAPTPGASGVAEGGYSLLFTQFVARKDIFPLLFYWRFFTKYVGILIGVIIFFKLILKGESTDEE
ncbi:MAG: lysylphosphatidylglycerol synthase transmembrane domain-containing protein [Bacillota bacterium]